VLFRSRRSLWIHSLAVALCAKLMYSKEFGYRENDVYMAEILHDLGIIVENQFLGDEFVAVLNKTSSLGSIHAAENSVLGFCHEDVGAGLGKMWNFPPVLCDVLGAAERPELVKGAYGFATHTIYVANRACQARGIGYNELPGADPRSYSRYLSLLDLNERTMGPIMDEVEVRIRQMSEEGWF
jgi:HD-like signal output (HDOD) protein